MNQGNVEFNDSLDGANIKDQVGSMTQLPTPALDNLSQNDVDLDKSQTQTIQQVSQAVSQDVSQDAS